MCLGSVQFAGQWYTESEVSDWEKTADADSAQTNQRVNFVLLPWQQRLTVPNVTDSPPKKDKLS